MQLPFCDKVEECEHKNQGGLQTPLRQYEPKLEGMVKLIELPGLISKFGKARCIAEHQGSVAMGSNLGSVLVLKDGVFRLIECRLNCICSLDIFEDYIVLGCEDGSVGVVYKNEFSRSIGEVLGGRIMRVKFVYRGIGSHLSCVAFDDRGDSRVVHLIQGLFEDIDYQLQYLLGK